MSYILDALRRADAERERDPGRGIHAQPLPLPAESPRRGPLWITAGLALAALVVAGALLLRPAPRVTQSVGLVQTAPVVRPAPPPPTIVPVATSVSPPPPTIVVAPPERSAPPPALATAKVAPAAVRSTVPTPAPGGATSVAVAVPPAAAGTRASAGTAAAAAHSAGGTPPAAGTPAAAGTAAAAGTPAAPIAAIAPGAPAAPAADRVLALSELPGDVQRELPKLQVSGGVYSDNPSQRMLIVGGQVMTEGAEPAPGVVLEQIRPRSAVLKFRGYRYSVQY